jgi:hypothetical protein
VAKQVRAGKVSLANGQGQWRASVAVADMDIGTMSDKKRDCLVSSIEGSHV